MMKRLSVLMIVLFLFLVACDSEKTDLLSLDDVIIALEEEGFTLDEYDMWRDAGFFGYKYNQVEPALYTVDGADTLEGDWFSIYVYDSKEDAEKGLRGLEDTIGIKFVPYLHYEVKNVLIVFVPGQVDEASGKAKYDDEIKRAVQTLENK